MANNVDFEEFVTDNLSSLRQEIETIGNELKKIKRELKHLKRDGSHGGNITTDLKDHDTLSNETIDQFLKVAKFEAARDALREIRGMAMALRDALKQNPSLKYTLEHLREGLKIWRETNPIAENPKKMLLNALRTQFHFKPAEKLEADYGWKM